VKIFTSRRNASIIHDICREKGQDFLAVRQTMQDQKLIRGVRFGSDAAARSRQPPSLSEPVDIGIGDVWHIEHSPTPPTILAVAGW